MWVEFTIGQRGPGRDLVFVLGNKEGVAAVAVIECMYSPMSNVQGVYLIIVDPPSQEDIRAFSVIVLTSEPGSGAHYYSSPNGPLTLIEYNPSCSCSAD